MGDLGATYDDHLRLIGKRVVDFLLALIELFSLGVTAEELRAIMHRGNNRSKSVCLCVNHDGTNHNYYMQRLVITCTLLS